MLRTVLVVAAAVGAAVSSGVGASAERPDVQVTSVIDGGTIDRDDFDGGNGGDGANR
jgi:hypothetical protein